MVYSLYGKFATRYEIQIGDTLWGAEYCPSSTLSVRPTANVKPQRFIVQDIHPYEHTLTLSPLTTAGAVNHNRKFEIGSYSKKPHFILHHDEDEVRAEYKMLLDKAQHRVEDKIAQLKETIQAIEKLRDAV